jgi:Undecaprenyl-phosphate glucose phosphotransferase
MWAGDLIGSVCLNAVTYWVYVGRNYYDSVQFWTALCGFVFAWIVASATIGLYSNKTLLGDQGALLLKGIMACSMTFGVILLLEFALKLIGDVSRAWLLTWAAGVFVWATILRLSWIHHLSRFFRRGGCLERALILGGTEVLAHEIGDSVRRESRGRIGIELVALIPGLPGSPTVESIEDMIRKGRVERVIISGLSGAELQTERLLQRLARVAVDVTIIPDLGSLNAPAVAIDRIGMLPAIELRSRPLTDIQVTLKRAEDLVLASMFLLTLAPLFAIIAIAIKLDSRGPVFFRQEREGYHNHTFWLWKFRTMHHETRDPSGLRQTSRGDARVTRVGRILRRLSFDELPQLINVVRGEMSIIGPRPHALGMTAVGSSMHNVLEDYPARYRLKPGITGWAQINGCRGEIDTHEKLRRRVYLDCYYIDNWSLSFDIRVMLRTAALLFFDSDAY